METLCIGSASSHFVHGVDSIRDHFSGRRINEQLGYYQGLMDHPKRGNSLYAPKDEQKRATSETRNAAQEQPPETYTSIKLEPFDRSGSSPRPASRLGTAYSHDPRERSNQQGSLPSFSSLDHDLTGKSKLQDEIIARYGSKDVPSSHQPGSSPDMIDRLGLPRLPRIQGLNERSPHTTPLLTSQFPSASARLDQSSKSDPASYRNLAPSDSRLSHTQLSHPVIVSPNAATPIRNDTSFSAGWVQRSYNSQAAVTESSRPLSDILEKTHAQIASQHQRSDSAMERVSSHTPQPEPVHPGMLQRPAPFVPAPEQLSPSLRHNQHQGLTQYGVPQPGQHVPHARLGPPMTTYHQHEHPVHRHHLPSTTTPGLSSVHGTSAGIRKRRGNLPRDAVRLFKKWVEENKRYPYPNEVQKQEFERLTGLSMQQINNWFINARRRNLSERERAEMKREKERQSQSTSPHSSRPSSSNGLPDPDAFQLEGLSGRPDGSREQSHDTSQRLGRFQPYEGET